MAEQVPLKIMIVGKDAEKIFKSAYVKALLEEGDIVTVGDTDADLVIGTSAVRTYENTTQYLKTIIKKVRAEKTPAKVEGEKPKKKKATAKKIKEMAAVLDEMLIAPSTIEPPTGLTLEAIETIKQELIGVDNG